MGSIQKSLSLLGRTRKPTDPLAKTTPSDVEFLKGAAAEKCGLTGGGGSFLLKTRFNFLQLGRVFLCLSHNNTFTEETNCINWIFTETICVVLINTSLTKNNLLVWVNGPYICTNVMKITSYSIIYIYKDSTDKQKSRKILAKKFASIENFTTFVAAD